MGEGAQLVEGIVVQRAPGQVVGHGFTLGVWPTSPAAVGSQNISEQIGGAGVG